jgi:glycosyltransferase involved in cell wall biosynthesis
MRNIDNRRSGGSALGDYSVLVTAEQLRRRSSGGIGTYVNGLRLGLSSYANVRTELFASRSSDTKHTDDIDHPVIHYPFRSFPLGHRATGLLWGRGVGRFPRVTDIVHATSFSVPVRAKNSPPYSMFVHDLAWRKLPDAFPKRGVSWHEAGLQRALRSVDRFIVPSTLTADMLLDAGAKSQQINVVPEGCDHLPLPGQADVTGGDHILVVATLEPRKNLARLIESYARIRNQLPHPWPLKIVGASGWGGRPTDGGESSVRESLPNSLPAGVELLGAVSNEELARLLRNARAFAYVPLFEGFGLPPLEAMRYGVPVLASTAVPSVSEPSVSGSSTAVPSVSEPSVSGSGVDDSAALLVDPMSTDELSQGLIRITSDAELRADLQVRGRTLADQRTWAACAAGHVAVWDEMLS